MYTPGSFRVDDPDILHALIREHSFGILTSHDGERPLATHLPFMLDTERGGPNGTLVAHMARANPHWRTWTESTRVLAIFQGPHAYISPAWYETREAVPTWNYAAVHAYGRPRLVHDPDQLRRMVTALVELHEDRAGTGWGRGPMESVMSTQLQAIVGFEIPIDAIEGKLKFNQNRSRADQQGVADHLLRSADALARASGEIMRRNLVE